MYYINALNQYLSSAYNSFSQSPSIHPAAKAYAAKAAFGLYDDYKQANKTLQTVSEQNTLDKAVGFLSQEDNQKALRSALLLPAKALHEAKNVHYLAGVRDGGYTQRLEDDFVIIEKPKV